MRTLTFILCGALWLVPLAGQAQSAGPAALAQAEARLEQLETERAQAQQRLAQLDEERDRLAQALQQLGQGSSSLLVAERTRLQRGQTSVERQRAAQASKLQQLDSLRRSEGLAVLALYQHALARQPDPALQARRDALQTRLGLGAAARGPAQIMEQVEQIEQAEAKLRRKAAQVASKIRQLRKQQRLAGDVARTMRDQALFDEEERRLEQTRASVRPEVNRSATSGGDQSSDGRSAGECTGSNCGSAVDVGTPGAGGNAPPAADDGDTAGSYDPGANEGFSGNGGTAAVTTGQARGSSALLSDLVAGSRVTTLLDEDLDTLLGRGGLKAGGSADSELLQLENLRVELLRSADGLASERQQLESRARSPRP